MIGSEPVLSVSEFIAVFNQTMEVTYPRVGIVGELANFRISRNQWVFFELKDDESNVKFFGTSRQLPGPLKDGLFLEVFGRPRHHKKYGFSINIDTIRVTGEGSLKKAQDLLAGKLKAEGLFEPARKRTLPFAPARIGLITASDSAAYGDFKKVLDARWGGTIVKLMDTPVQGVDAPSEIIKSMRKFNEMAGPPEVLALVRGGGSPEDMACFSDERVVRAVAASRIPTVVAIGHEADISLSELAADRRASTPSNAAEILVPDRAHEMKVIAMQANSLKELLKRMFEAIALQLADYRENALRLTEYALENARRDLEHNKNLLTLLDPHSPLRRGYAIVRDSKDRVIRSVHQVKTGQGMVISFSDGTIKGRVEGKPDGK